MSFTNFFLTYFDWINSRRSSLKPSLQNKEQCGAVLWTEPIEYYEIILWKAFQSFCKYSRKTVHPTVNDFKSNQIFIKQASV